MTTWRFLDPEFRDFSKGEVPLPYRRNQWILPLEINGEIFTVYRLTRDHAPFCRTDSLERAGVDTATIEDIKTAARKAWDDWVPFSHIVQGARP